MRTVQRVGASVLVVVLAAGLAACGDDDNDDTTEETTASGSETEASSADAEFCDPLVEFNSKVLQVELDETSSEEDIKAAGEELGPLTADLAEHAPDDLADAATDIDDAVQPLTEGDAEAFNSDAVFETYTEFLSGGVEACEFESVPVSGIDYAFEGVPASIEAGTTAFAFTNESDAEEHEMILLRKGDGVTMSFQEILELPEEEAMTNAEFVGATFAPPGGEGSTLAELEAGDYAMACFIPVGGAEDGPPHFLEGMLQEFVVE